MNQKKLSKLIIRDKVTGQFFEKEILIDIEPSEEKIVAQKRTGYFNTATSPSWSKNSFSRGFIKRKKGKKQFALTR
jgi:hypothetical protein